MNTDQLEQAVDAYGTVAKIGVAAIRPFLKSPIDEGCRPALFAATSEDIIKEGVQGQYVGFRLRWVTPDVMAPGAIFSIILRASSSC